MKMSFHVPVLDLVLLDVEELDRDANEMRGLCDVTSHACHVAPQVRRAFVSCSAARTAAFWLLRVPRAPSSVIFRPVCLEYDFRGDSELGLRASSRG